MKKIKNIITLNLFILMLTILFSIFINQKTMENYQLLDAYEAELDDIKIYYNNENLPLKVLANIAGQDFEADSDKATTLLDAYERNTALILEESNNLKQGLDQLYEHFEGLSFPISWLMEETHLLKEMDHVSQVYATFDDNLNTYLSAQGIASSEVIQSLSSTYETLEVDIQKLHQVFRTYYSDVRHLLIFLDNGFYIFLFLTILALIMILFRFIFQDLPYIMESIRKLEHHDYSPSLLKRKMYFDEEVSIADNIDKIFEEQRLSTDFKNDVMNTYLMDDIIDKLFHRLSKLMAVDRVGIAFVDYTKNKIIAEYGTNHGHPILLGPGFQVSLDKTSLKGVIDSRKGIINNDLIYYNDNHGQSGALDLITEEGIRSNMTLPLVSGDMVFGLVFISSERSDYFTDDHFRVAQKMIYEIEGFLNRAYLMKVILSKVTTSFAELVDQKDNETGGHINRMVDYSVAIAHGVKKLNLDSHPMDKDTILQIKRNASVHDIGKVGIPDAILKKPGKLTPEEWQVMKTHATIGGDIFKGLRKDMTVFDYDFYEIPEQIARYHHEKFNGQGYPEGLSGHDIPLVARIVALADVFDALTSERVYKKAFSFEQALSVIQEESGQHFDPIVVKAFMDQLDTIRKIYTISWQK